MTGRRTYEPPMYVGPNKNGKFTRLVKEGSRWVQEPTGKPDPMLLSFDFASLERAILERWSNLMDKDKL